MQRYLSLLAWLVGMPVLGAGWELQSLELNYRVRERERSQPTHLWPLPADRATCSGDAKESLVFSQFVAACATYTQPSPDDLSPLRDEIFGWLRRRDRALGVGPFFENLVLDEPPQARAQDVLCQSQALLKIGKPSYA